MNRFLSQCLAWLDARASWVQLSNIRDSFLSKATTAFSVATFGLANLAAPLGRLGVDLWQLRLLFPGSMLFLIGYLVMAIRIPLEFQGSRTLDEIVDRMSRVHTYTFLKSRLDMTRAMLDRREAKGTPERMRGAVKYAKAEAVKAEAAKEGQGNWESLARGLYHADVNLRQYDRPMARTAALFCLCLGLLLLLIPTIASVFRAMAGLVS